MLIADVTSGAATRVGRLQVVLHWGAPSVDDVRELGALADEWETTYRGEHAMLVVIEAGAGMVDGDARRELERQYAAKKERLVALAQVIEETGFTGAAIRGVFHAIGLLLGRGTKLRTFATLDAALDWLGETAPGVAEAGDVEEVVRALRERRPR